MHSKFLATLWVSLYKGEWYKVKVKSSMARSLPVENLLPQNVGSIINYLQYFTEVAQWGAPSCIRPQPATDNGVTDSRSNLTGRTPHPTQGSTPELHVLHSSMRDANHKTYCTDWDANVRPSERQANCSATQSIKTKLGVAVRVEQLLCDDQNERSTPWSSTAVWFLCNDWASSGYTVKLNIEQWLGPVRLYRQAQHWTMIGPLSGYTVKLNIEQWLGPCPVMPSSSTLQWMGPYQVTVTHNLEQWM